MNSMTVGYYVTQSRDWNQEHLSVFGQNGGESEVTATKQETWE